MTFDEIKKYLTVLDGPVEKLEFIMDLGNTLQPVPSNAKCYEVAGCASFVQICQSEDRFYANADSALVRGIMAVFIAMVDGKSVQQIKEMNLADEFGALNLQLGAGRTNGVNSVIRFFENL